MTKIENHTQLVWQQGHGTDFAKLLLQLLPGITPVFAQVHVTVEAGRDDYVGSLLVGGYPIDMRVGLYRQGHRLPTFPGIPGALYGTGDTGNSVAVADKHDIGVIRFDDHAAAVRCASSFMELGEIVVISAFAFVVAGSDAKGRGTVDCGTGASLQSHTVNVAMEGLRPQVGKVDPGVAAIQALVNPVNLHASPDGVVVPGIYHHAGGPLWRVRKCWRQGALHVYAHMKLAPSPPPIPGAESLGSRAYE